MGNYEQLKQAISDVIKTNGNQEITGAILQNALLSIISTVGSNATFAGVAVPTTNPGTPDANVFYLASQNGTYLNFGGVTLNNEVIIFSNENGTWKKTSTGIATSDNVNAINNIVSSIGYYECNSEPNNPQKMLSIDGITSLTNKIRLIVKMTNENTIDNVILKINSLTAKPLYYNNKRVSSNNSWKAGEIIDMYYDGENFYSKNFQGGVGDGNYNFVEYNKTDSETRLLVEEDNRKVGYMLGYDKPTIGLILETYISKSITDNEWKDEKNWARTAIFKKGNNYLFSPEDIQINKSILNGVIYNSQTDFVSNKIYFNKGDKLFIHTTNVIGDEPRNNMSPAINLIAYDDSDVKKWSGSVNVMYFDTSTIDDLPNVGYLLFSNKTEQLKYTYVTKEDNEVAEYYRTIPYYEPKDGNIARNNNNLMLPLFSLMFPELYPDLAVGNYLNNESQYTFLKKCDNDYCINLGILNWIYFGENEGITRYDSQKVRIINFSLSSLEGINYNISISFIIYTDIAENEIKDTLTISPTPTKLDIVKLDNNIYKVDVYIWQYNLKITQKTNFILKINNLDNKFAFGGFCVQYQVNNGQHIFAKDYYLSKIYKDISSLVNATINKVNTLKNDIYSNTSYWYGKTIVMTGMSIASGGKYTDNACKMLGANCISTAYNGAIGERGSTLQWGLASDMTDDTESLTGYRSYEHALLGKNKDGSTIFNYNDVDLFIIDLGVNDFPSPNMSPEDESLKVNELDPYNRDDEAHKYTGGINYVIREIYRAKPNARIAMINHFEKSYRNGAYIANNNIAKFWNIPILNDADFLGMNTHNIFEDETYNNILQYYCGSDMLHPYEHDSILMKKRAFIVAQWLRSIA